MALYVIGSPVATFNGPKETHEWMCSRCHTRIRIVSPDTDQLWQLLHQRLSKGQPLTGGVPCPLCYRPYNLFALGVRPRLEVGAPMFFDSTDCEGCGRKITIWEWSEERKVRRTHCGKCSEPRVNAPVEPQMFVFVDPEKPEEAKSPGAQPTR